MNTRKLIGLFVAILFIGACADDAGNSGNATPPDETQCLLQFQCMSGQLDRCTPELPVQAKKLGRIIGFSQVDLNGTGGPRATVAPGAMVSLRVVGNIQNTGEECFGCVT